MKLKEGETRRSPSGVRPIPDRAPSRDLLELYLDEAGGFRVLDPDEQTAVLHRVVRQRHVWLSTFLDTEAALEALRIDLDRVAAGEIAAGVLIPGPPRPDGGTVEDFIARLHRVVQKQCAQFPKRPFRSRRKGHRRLIVKALLYVGLRPAVLERYEEIARQAGDKALGRRIDRAREAFLEERRPLIEHNLRLVFKVARQFVPGPLSLADLIQEGNLGLIRSTESFNPKFSVRFSTYAYLWIRQSIIRALENKSRTIRLPVSVTQRMRRFEMHQRTGAPPSEATDDDPETQVHAAILRNPAVAGVLSLNDRVEDGETALADLVPDPTPETPDLPVRVEDLKDQVASCLNSLPGRERLVLRLRFGIECGRPHTLAELGSLLAVSPERVRQIQMSAFRNLKDGPCAGTLEKLVLD